MGQKVNPVGFRLGVNRGWDSVWYAKKKDFGNGALHVCFGWLAIGEIKSENESLTKVGASGRVVACVFEPT